MFYITTESIVLQCSYEEPIYDEHPDIGTYESFHEVTIPPLTGIKIDQHGKVLWCDIKRSFGVSMHPGTLTVRTKLKDKIGTSVVPVSESDLDSVRCCLCEIESLQEERADILFNIKELEDYEDEMLAEKCASSVFLSQTDYELLSDQLWEDVRKDLELRFSLAKINSKLSALKTRCHWYLDKFTARN